MPFYPPGATSYVCLDQWLKRLSGVEQSDGGVVTTNSNQMFDVWVTLNASHSSVEPKHPLDYGRDRRCALKVNTPSVGDNRLFKTLSYIPYLKLQVITSLLTGGQKVLI